MQCLSIDMSQVKSFVDALGKAGKGDFKKSLVIMLEGLGDKFIEIVQDEIIRKDVTDTRLLLQSFEKGSNDGIFKISEGNLTLEVGTNVKYARHVNDGHWLNKAGVATRWVPGVFNGELFTYIPGAETGMLLKQKFIAGKRYWEDAIRMFERILPERLERELQDWLDNYFRAFM